MTRCKFPKTTKMYYSKFLIRFQNYKGGMFVVNNDQNVLSVPQTKLLKGFWRLEI